MATGIVTFPAADYAPGDPGPSRAVVTVTPWAGDSAISGAEDLFYSIIPGLDATAVLEETDGTFCYRVVIQTPATLEDEVRFVRVAASASPVDFGSLTLVDPYSFAPVAPTPSLIQTIETAVAAYLIANPPAGTDATTLAKGIVQLAGDLAGAADAPTVPALALKAALVHSHAQADVTGLAAALAALAPLVHTHAEGDVTGLVADLAAKASISHGHAQAEITGLVATLALLAPLISPAFTGTPTAPTAAPGTNTTQLANTAFVQAAVAAIVNSSPAALDTLAELATALGNDANFATTIATSLGLKAPIASPTLTGVPAAPTAAPGTNTTQLATTAFVAALGALKANLASPTFTGTPAAPTPTAGDSSTKIATTAFVAGELAAVVPKALVDAKGDLFAGSANDTVVRVAVGADGQILTADAASAGGVKWAPAPSTFPPLAADLVGMAQNIPRSSITAGTLSSTSGDLYLQFMTVHTAGACARPLLFNSSTPASGMTLAKIALFDVAPNGDLTRIAITADLGATTTAHQNHTPAWLVAPTLTVGQRVAVGILSIGGGTNLSLRGMSVNGSAVLAYGPPHLVRQITGQTDILSSYVNADQAFFSTNVPYCALLP